MNKITKTKKIAKQGKNNVTIIPKCLKHKIPAGTLFKIDIEQIYENELNENQKREKNE